MTEHPTVYSSGGLLTPGILDELQRAPSKGEFAPGSFRLVDGAIVADLDATLEATFVQLCALFDRIAPELAYLERSALRERWTLPLLGALDWQPKFQASRLKPHSLDDATFGISHLGWDDPNAPPIHIEPTFGAELGLDARPAPRKPSPHDLLQGFLNLAPQQWGLVTDGRELRAVRDFHHSTAKGFVAVDLEALFASRDFAAFQALWRLAHVSRFLPADPGDPASPSPVESLYRRSQAAGITVGRALHGQVRQAIEIFANGVAAQDPSIKERLADAQQARKFYGEVLDVVYRLLFLFFAEQRGLLPGRDTLYAEAYSVTRLRDLAEHPAQVEGRRTDLYEGLKVTFRLMANGSEAMGIHAFNGHLFDAAATPTMTAATLVNRDLVRAIRALTSVEAAGQRQFVAYSTLGVEELGAVYESLLDYTPRVAEGPVTTSSGTVVPSGGLYLEQVGERELGSYYTPPDLVAFTLDQALDPLLDERLAGLTDPTEQETALLDIRAIDPACGSGAFLVAVIDRLADRLTQVRLGGLQPTEQQLAQARRDVLQHCIYGVDVDPFAVELCKVALWIHCAVADLPLTFLDHRIQCGNSLIGWPLRDLPAEIPLEAYQPKSQTSGDPVTKQVCDIARKRNKAVLEGQGELFTPSVSRPDVRLDYPILWIEEERSPADVEKKAAAYADYVNSMPYRLWSAAADIWLSSFFWTADFGDVAPVSSDYWRAKEIAEHYRDGELLDEDVTGHLNSELLRGVTALAGSLNPLHWPLRFPEIAERGGFDLVTGNPPWEQFESREQEWFALRAPSIARLKGNERKKAIEELETGHPTLGLEWRTFSTSNARLTDYARRSGRFSSRGGKVNTYLLFTETNASNLSTRGKAGFIVKSSLGTDQGGQPVFQPLLQAGRVHGFYDFVNGGRGEAVIFRGVAEVERFAVVILGSPREPPVLEVSLMNWNIEEARARQPLVVSTDKISRLNPVTRSLPSFRELEHWEIADRIHQRFETLDFDIPSAEDLALGRRSIPSNLWNLRYATLFNSTTDSGSFCKREALESGGWKLGTDMIFRRGAEEEALPLYEGQLINRYDHRARTYAGYPVEKKYGRKPGIPLTIDTEKADPFFEIEPRYWMEASLARERLIAAIGENSLVAFRDVGATWTNQRSARAAVIPQRPATDKLPVFGVPLSSVFEFLALFNSLVFDFLVRGKMPGSGVKLVWMLSQIAAPPPEFDQRISEAAKSLSLTSASVAEEFGVEPQAWDPDERYALDVELDARIAHTYRLTEMEYSVVINTFSVLARKEIAAHGHYRLREDCLKQYRRLA